VAEQAVRADLEQTLSEALKKADYCNDAGGNLGSALTELQSQHDTVRQQIEDAYKSYKRMLESIKDQMLNELGRLHSDRELKIMDLMQSMENNMGKLQQAAQFGQRAIDKANAVEFLLLKPVINAQCLNLMEQTPKCDVNYQLQFDSKPEKFEQFAREMFGKFQTDQSDASPKKQAIAAIRYNIIARFNNFFLWYPPHQIQPQAEVFLLACFQSFCHFI